MGGFNVRRFLRGFSMLLSVVLIASLVPLAAFAEPLELQPSAAAVDSAGLARHGAMPPLGLHSLGMTALAADDEIPGVALGASPMTGSLSLNDDDWVDVYSFSMAPGQVFSAELTMPAGRSFVMDIFDPTGTSVYEYTGYSAYSEPWDATRQRVQAPSYALGGTYYVVVWLIDENPYYGQYSLSWQKHTLGGDDDVPGALAPAASPSSGALDWRTDPSDVYKFDLTDDQVLTLSLSAGSGSASTAYPVGGFDMYTYQAGAMTVWGTDWTTWGVNTRDGGSSTATKSYYCPPGGAGTMYVEIHSELSAATYNLTWQVTDPNSTRLSGANRYETSYEISKANFVSAGTAVLAAGTSFADALCASGLAGELNAPLLLIPPKILDDGYLTDDGRAFRNECMRLGVTRFEVVGGEAAISSALLADAKLVTDVSSTGRYSGADRYATSANVMNRIVSLNGGPTSVALVARGDKFADALSAAPFAYSYGYPILLTKSDALPTTVKSALQSATPATAYVLGGNAAVFPSVFTAIDGIVPAVSRKDGADRYATALNFASFVVDDLGAASWADVGLATGVNFPDALSGGAACGARGGVLLLTQPDALNVGVAAKIADEAADIDRVTIFGGTSAVSSAARTQLDAILNP